jgi:hypothetical protein
MVLENTFVELVENVWSEAGEYIGVRKVFPERFVDRSDPFFIEGCKTSTRFFVIQNYLGAFLFPHRGVEEVPSLI